MIVSKTKFTILIAAALFFAIGTQAESNNAVNYKGDIRHDRVAMIHARNDIRADRHDLRVDRRDYFHDRYDLHRDRRCW